MRRTSIIGSLVLAIPLAVVPVLAGSLQVLVALLPAVFAAIATLLVGLFRPATLKKLLRVLWAQKVAILVLVVVVGSGRFLVRQVQAQRDRAPEAIGAVGSWPMFRGTLDRRGVADNSPDPVRSKDNWVFADAMTFYCSPAVVGDRVYATSAEASLFFDTGAVYCLDANTGEVVWQSAPDEFRATISSPAVSGKYLVCGEGLHYTENARVVCMDITRKGAIVWEFRTKSHVESSPCIWRDRVYVGAGDDGYYCLALEPDKAGKPRVLWHAPGDHYPDAETAPAVHDGKVYVGLGNNGNAICCLDADDGRELWRVATPYPVFTAPTVANGNVFVGMGNGNLIETAEEARERILDEMRAAGKTEAEIAEARKRLGPAGEVWCLDAASGQVKWRFRTHRIVLGAIAAGSDRIYFGSRDRNFYCLSFEGQEIARWDAGSPIVASPALGKEHVYLVAADGTLHCLRSDNLEPVWKTQLGTEGQFLSAPTIAHGRVYLGTGQDGLRCVGEPGGAQVAWRGPLGGPGRTGCVDGSSIPEYGSMPQRLVPLADGDTAASLAPPAVIGQTLFVPVAAEERNGLACFQASPQNPAAEELWFYATPTGVYRSPVADKDVVLCVDGKPGDVNRSVHCLEAATGHQRWRFPIDADSEGWLLLGSDEVLVQDGSSSLARLDLHGKLTWRQETGTLTGCPSCMDAIVVAASKVSVSSYTLMALDRFTGQTLWRAPLDLTPTTGPVVIGATIYVGTAEGLSAYSLVDGSPIWHCDAGGVEGAFAVEGGKIAYVSSRSELVVLDAANGRVRARVPGASRWVPPLASAGALLYASKNGLVRYDLLSGNQYTWLETTALGQIDSPLTMADATIYFACHDARLASVSGLPG